MTKNQYLPPKVRRPREHVIPFVGHLEEYYGLVVAGSYRRGKDTIGDLDILVPPHRDFEEAVAEFMDTLSYEPARSGAMKSEGWIPFGDDNDPNTLLINLWRVPDVSAWGGMLLFATGPYDLNIKMRGAAKGRGWLLSQYGLFTQGVGDQDGKQLDGAGGDDHDTAEQEIFALLDIPYLSPVERETWRDALLPNRAADRKTVEIMSSDGVTVYHVDINEDGKAVHCECKGFGYRSNCRHLREAEVIYGK
jgi:DNA polymerase (family 10)